MFGLVRNTWFHSRRSAGAGMVVRFFILNSNRGRKPGAGNWNEVRGLQEKGKRSYYSRDTNIGYLTGRFKSKQAKDCAPLLRNVKNTVASDKRPDTICPLPSDT